ncbi:MAG TPA: hypothetical protein VGR25_10325 [bacterium]|nr:hypothetical protein [bacterium]
MRLRPSFFFSLAIALGAAWALWETWGWPIKTALYPRAVVIPLLLLAAGETALSLRPEKDEAGPVSLSAARTSKEVMEVIIASEVPEEVALRRTAVTVLWLVGFLLAVLLVGFPRAIPLFVFAYLKGAGREGVVPSLLLTVVAWAIFQGLFVTLLHLPFAEGWLWGILIRYGAGWMR